MKAKAKRNGGFWRVCVDGRRGPAMAVVAVLTLIAATAIWAEESTTVEDARLELEKWVETERVISKEKRDLALAREMLNERIELVKREIETAKSKIADTKKNIAESEKKRDSLRTDNRKMKDVSDSMLNRLLELEGRTRSLLERLPEPIRERVKPLSQRLPEPGKENNATVATRFQNVVGILNEVGKFNSTITVVSETRSLPDGTMAEVSAVYLGVGQGYYCGQNGAIGGYGTVSETGWTWRPDDAAAANIAQVIAILKNEQAAAFVRLPMEIK